MNFSPRINRMRQAYRSSRWHSSPSRCPRALNRKLERPRRLSTTFSTRGSAPVR